ncbi:hypothetical protein KUTeg_018210 [Tegillarca granosa]|uniref:Protein MAK10 homolog n=1 Tax=Tegillarca granosa TaxID=220873 RepID=A0ABQ9EH71_TEGGR|nr:hypothetical protein KUTeg_018210 [Tegillarca granosa]
MADNAMSLCSDDQNNDENSIDADEREDKERPVYNWKDVTKEFIEASSQLQLGELLHDSSFGLFEAMSAIEMMDPKMDAGMMCNQIHRKAKKVKIKNLEIPEVIGIIDATVACMVTWLEGHSLAQTVFTNLYLHNPYIIEDRNVRATGMMKEVEDDLHRILKNTRVKQGENQDDSTKKEHMLTLALFSRIKYHRLFFSLLLSFNKEKCEGIPQAEKLLKQLQELIPSIRSTLDLGIQPDSQQVNKNDYPTIMGFEPLVNQRLLPPTFPRYTIIKSREEAVNYMETLLKRLYIVTTVPEMTSLHMVMDSFREFSKSSPCVLSRSVLQLTLLPPNRRVFGTTTVIDYLKDTIRNFIAPPVLSSKSALYNNSQAKAYLDAWLMQAVRPICNMVQITGHNRARQRDKWGHILEDLSALQEEHETVADNQQKGRSNKKNKKKKKVKTLNKEITVAQAEQQMFGGFYKAVLGFRLDEKLKQPNFEFDSEEVRYSHRFLPFTNVTTPPCIHYDQYKEMSDLRRYEPEANAQNLYGASCKCFHQAKTPPEFDFSLHKVYPVIKIS